MPEGVLREEAARLASLADYEILDTAPESPFDRVVRLVCSLLRVPMATVTFVDADRQWFKARVNVEDSETERRYAVCDHTIRSREPLIVPDLREDPRFAQLPAVSANTPLRAYLGVPLVTPDGHALGALCALDHVPHHFTASDVAAMEGLAGLVVDWLEMRRISRVDFLTGALTRRAFTRRVAREIETIREGAPPGALVVFDVDHFKSMNDSFGHAAGDEVLRRMAEMVAANLRQGDSFARLGGEEFALLLTGSGADAAFAVAERARESIAAHVFPSLGERSVTASFGVAAFAGSVENVDGWIAAADRALYRAKEGGRNRTVIAQ